MYVLLQTNKKKSHRKKVYRRNTNSLQCMNESVVLVKER